MQKTLLLFSLIFFFSFSTNAEEYNGCEADNLIHGTSKIWMNDDNQTIKFFQLEQPVSVAPGQMEEWLKATLKTDSQTGFELYKVDEDKLGYKHYRFRQTYNGFTVTNGVYYVHTVNGQVVSANGELYPHIDVSVVPVITPEGAIAIGKEHIHGHVWAWEEGAFPMPQLQVVAANDTYHFAYKTDIYSLEPLARKWLMIDALSGEVVAEYNRIHANAVDGEAHCKYHGVQTITVDSISPTEYRLIDEIRNVQTYDLNNGTDYDNAVDFTDSDNIWDTTTDDDDAALDAHWGTEGMHDYMLNVHGWDSYNGAGAPMISYVHYGNDFYNAFWNGEYMTYGDGNGYDAGPLTSTEVVGHEVMHGVTEYNAGLIYSDESGALNESYSDCFGVILDFELNPLTANFLMGDDFSSTGTPFRNMGDPNEYLNPDTYGGLYWDNPGVHNRSGVQNFWFYLITQGGTGTNDIGDDYDVTPIPMAEAADILFRSLSVYLTPSSPYADARFYDLISAGDLYGDCTQQQISVADAWYAVGVGDLFDNTVVAGVGVGSQENCQLPAFVQFYNNSQNGSTYMWDFGNGTTSTEENPVAQYTTEGTYTVTLTTTGVGLCAGSDQIVLVDFITIDNTGGPTPPSCTPLTTSPLTQRGIFQFDFNTISNPSDGSTDNYQDYTCTYSSNVQEGVLYPLSVQTGEDENVRVWIDVDNDGVFNNTNELVYDSPEPASLHSAQIIVPATAATGVPIRLRVKSDFMINDITDPCNPVVNGQVEDYTLFVSDNNQAPATDFVADETIVLVGSSVNFTDLTQNLPESWYWEFDGGEPATSTDQHPTITYNTLGTYQVSLMATNQNGNATELKTDYITVSQIATMCTNEVTNAGAGLFYDSGGPSGNYSNQELCTFLIQPDCAQDISLDFTELALEPFYDYMYVYDGVDDTAPLLATLNGFTVPPTITATSGTMYIVFDSDFSVTDPGWAASWSSTTPTEPPTADFSISNTNTPLNIPVQFTDLSTEFPSEWSWDFGDGETSNEQNPMHAYTMPGTYTVELTVSNCFDSATITYTLTVQPPPAITVNPSSIEVTLGCDEEVIVPLTVTNNGQGDLIYSFDGSAGGNNILDSILQRINLRHTELTDLMPEMFEFFGGETGIEIGDGGGDMYDGGNILSVDDMGPIPYSGGVIFADPNMGTDGQYFTTKHPGLFVFAADINDVDLFSIDGDLGADGGGAVLGAELDVDYQGTSYKGFVKRVYDAFDPSVNHLIIVEDNGSLVQTVPTTTFFDEHDIEGLSTSNRIYYLLFAKQNGGFYTDAEMEIFMNKFLEIIDGSSLMTLPEGSFELGSNSSETHDLVFNSTGVDGGVYESVITVTSNDPSLGVIEIPVTVTVQSTPCTEFEFNLLDPCSGEVQFSDLSNNDPTSWSWDFGDGNMSTDQNPVHTYTSSGTYTVVLTATNASGSNEYELEVMVSAVSASISISGLLEVGETLVFDPNASAGANTYFWDFGNGATSTEAMPSYVYNMEGDYVVTLTVTNADGCEIVTTTEISIILSGLSELEAGISIYPNPSDGNLFIKNTGSEQYFEIEVVNTIGQVMKRVDTSQQTSDVFHLQLSDYPPGVYVIGLKFGGQQTLQKKIVIQKDQ